MLESTPPPPPPPPARQARHPPRRPPLLARGQGGVGGQQMGFCAPPPPKPWSNFLLDLCLVPAPRACPPLRALPSGPCTAKGISRCLNADDMAVHGLVSGASRLQSLHFFVPISTSFWGGGRPHGRRHTITVDIRLARHTILCPHTWLRKALVPVFASLVLCRASFV